MDASIVGGQVATRGWRVVLEGAVLEECNVQYHNEALKYAIWVEMSGFASLPLIRGLVLPWGLLQVSIHSGWMEVESSATARVGGITPGDATSGSRIKK